MKVYHSEEFGFIAQADDSVPPTHDIPDAEWRAYRKLVEAANDLEDRFLAGYAIEIDEYASVRGILTDDQIETLRGLGVSMSDDGPSKTWPVGGRARDAAPPERETVSALEEARRIIVRNASKCQHRHQSGPFADGTVRCSDCQGIIYGGTGVKKTVQDAGERDYHNPGKVNPDDFNGTV